MASPGSVARPAVIALVLGLGLLLALFALGVRAGTLALIGILVLGPGVWWRWKTRDFRRGLRALRRNRPEPAREYFRRFIARTQGDGGFLRYQRFFNLGRPYDYVAAAHNNLGVLALRSGDRARAREEFDAALDRDPGFAAAHYGRGALALLRGDPDAAERAAESGLAAEPGHRPSAILLALCRAERDDRRGAERALAEMRKPPDWETATRLWSRMYRFWGDEARSERWADEDSAEGE